MHLADFRYMAFCSLTFMPLSVTSSVSVFALDLPFAEIFAFLLFLIASSGALIVPFDFNRIY